MVSETEVLDFIKALGPFDREVIDGLDVFKANSRIFLVLKPKSDPLQLEVRTDRNLRKLLIGDYESVLPSKSLGSQGVTVLASGQLTDSEVLDLIRLSYLLSDAQA